MGCDWSISVYDSLPLSWWVRKKAVLKAVQPSGGAKKPVSDLLAISLPSLHPSIISLPHSLISTTLPGVGRSGGSKERVPGESEAAEGADTAAARGASCSGSEAEGGIE